MMTQQEATDVAFRSSPEGISWGSWADWLRLNGCWEHRDLIRTFVLCFVQSNSLAVARHVREFGDSLGQDYAEQRRLETIKMAVARCATDPDFAAACETVADHGWVELRSFIRAHEPAEEPAK